MPSLIGGLSVYSKHLLGSVKDMKTAPKKMSLLERFHVLNPVDRSITCDTVESVIVTFRIVNFSDADLQACRDMTMAEIVEYSNPCNMRVALKAAIAAFDFLGLDSSVLVCELQSRFTPERANTRNLKPSDVNHISSFQSLSDAVQVCSGDHGYTLVASRNISRGEKVISLKTNQSLSILSCVRDPKFPGKDLVQQGLHPDVVFLLYLIHLRDKSSTDASSWNIPNLWRDFFLVQPSSYGTLFELESSEIERLNEPELARQVVEQNEQLLDICKSLSPSPKFEDLLWAKSLCTSRAFSLPLAPLHNDKDDNQKFEQSLVSNYYPSGNLTCLIPFVHFFNHDFRAQCETPKIIDDEIILHSLVSIQANDEIFIIYGGMNNREFLLNYGFYIPNNPYDQIILPDGKLIRRGAQRRVTTLKSNLNVIDGYIEDRDSFINSV
jgi:hypothetical protein